MQSERTNTDVFLMKHLKYLRIFVVYLDMERKTFKALRKIDDESCKMLNMMKVVCVFFLYLLLHNSTTGWSSHLCVEVMDKH